MYKDLPLLNYPFRMAAGVAVYINSGRHAGDVAGKNFDVHGQCRKPAAVSLGAYSCFVYFLQHFFFKLGVKGVLVRLV
jgi:hypothetical protein